MVVICGFRISAETFKKIVDDWKSLAIVIKSSILDIGRVFGSNAGRKKMKYRFRSKAKVCHALHNLFQEGLAEPSFRKS